MNFSNKKVLVALALLVGLLVFISYRYLKPGSSEIVYITSKVDRNDITSRITTTGNLNPIKSIDVYSVVPGTVNKLSVDFNSQVSAGDPLAELYKDLLRTEVESAQAQVRKAQADFDQAKTLFENDKSLYEKRLISKEEYDSSQKKYSSTRAALEQSQVQLKKAEFNLKSAVIRSPMDGVVLSRNVERGQVVSPNVKPLFVVAQDMSQMKIDTNVSENHIGKVVEGQKVNFTVDAYPADVFEGEVSQIRNAPNITNNIVTYNVVVSIDNGDMKLKPGMTAEVNIVVADKKDVLRVPNAALRFVPPPSANTRNRPDLNSNDSHVWLSLKSGELTNVSVKTGKSDDMYTEILDGDLTEGQEVVVGFSSEAPSESNPLLPQPGRF